MSLSLSLQRCCRLSLSLQGWSGVRPGAQPWYTPILQLHAHLHTHTCTHTCTHSQRSSGSTTLRRRRLFAVVANGAGCCRRRCRGAQPSSLSLKSVTKGYMAQYGSARPARTHLYTHIHTYAHTCTQTHTSTPTRIHVHTHPHIHAHPLGTRSAHNPSKRTRPPRPVVKPGGNARYAAAAGGGRRRRGQGRWAAGKGCSVGGTAAAAAVCVRACVCVCVCVRDIQDKTGPRPGRAGRRGAADDSARGPAARSEKPLSDRGERERV
jgi:hypothetical protein